MQGRMVAPELDRFQCFPCTQWRDEFPRAAAAGLHAIEWIFDVVGEDVNPIATRDGIAEMRSLSAAHGIAVVSVCADYFMDRPIVRAAAAELSEIQGKLYWLLEQCRHLGIERMVMPFVDASKIQDQQAEDLAVQVLTEAAPKAAAAGVELHLETDLSPAKFQALLHRLPHASIKANYDSGNSASLGYNPVEEFAAYGSRIGSVHIKDRVLGGSTVPLGTGSANLPAVFQGLAKLGYSGDYVLQVAREIPGGEVAWIRQNRQYVAAQIAKAKSEGALS